MPRRCWQAIRLLLVCAVLAFTSAPARGAVGWFEAVVEIARVGEAAQQAAPQPIRARAEAPQSLDPRGPALAAAAGVPVARPNARRIVAVSRLYLFHSAFLC